MSIVVKITRVRGPVREPRDTVITAYADKNGEPHKHDYTPLSHILEEDGDECEVVIHPGHGFFIHEKIGKP